QPLKSGHAYRMTFALPCRSDSASAAVDQQPERSRNRVRLGLRLFRRGCGGRSEVGRIYKQLVGLGIERHVARAEFRLHGFHHAEIVRGVLTIAVPSGFGSRTKKRDGGWF